MIFPKLFSTHLPTNYGIESSDDLSYNDGHDGPIFIFGPPWYWTNVVNWPWYGWLTLRRIIFRRCKLFILTTNLYVLMLKSTGRQNEAQKFIWTVNLGLPNFSIQKRDLCDSEWFQYSMLWNWYFGSFLNRTATNRKLKLKIKLDSNLNRTLIEFYFFTINGKIFYRDLILNFMRNRLTNTQIMFNTLVRDSRTSKLDTQIVTKDWFVPDRSKDPWI